MAAVLVLKVGDEVRVDADGPHRSVGTKGRLMRRGWMTQTRHFIAWLYCFLFIGKVGGVMIFRVVWTAAILATVAGSAFAQGGGGIGPMPGSGQMSSICKFQTGPRAGQTQDYAPQKLPVGSPCWDGVSSSGVVVAAMGGGAAAGAGAVSTRCQFNAGPRAGTVQDYAPMPPVAVGTSCHDGQGSTGVVVP